MLNSIEYEVNFIFDSFFLIEPDHFDIINTRNNRNAQ